MILNKLAILPFSVLLIFCSVSAQETSVHDLVKLTLDMPLPEHKLVEGYQEPLAGQSMDYHSSLPDVNQALICRATDGTMAVSWQTAPLVRSGQDLVSFIWLAGLGANLGERQFDLFINGQKWVSFTTRQQTQWTVTGRSESRLQFIATKKDRNGDLFGYMILTVPGREFAGKNPLNLKVVGTNAGSNAWYMTFKNDRTVKQLEQTRANGFWYRLVWPEERNRLDLTMPAGWAGRIITITDAGVFRMERKLEKEGQHSTARFQLPADLALPIQISCQGKQIDRLDSLGGAWKASDYFDDRRTVIRTKSVAGNSHTLECSGNYFFDIVGSLQALGSSHFRGGKIHLVTSSHQDIAWMDSPENCVVDRDTIVITPALEMLRENPDYHYSAEQALMLKEYLGRHPQALEEIAALTRQGRLEWGASFNQPYEGMYSGESLIRQFYFGRKWIKKILPGCDTRLAWNLDVPGRTLQMAQIMKKSGVDYLLLSRHERGFFYWQSPDGSRIGAHSPGHYHWASDFLRHDTQTAILQTPQVVRSWESDFRKAGLPPELPVIYATDMSRPRDFSDLMNSWNHLKIRSADWSQVAEPDLPDFHYSTAEAALERIFQNNPDLPVIQGERPNVWLYIHGPTHHRALTASRQASPLLTAAETFATIRSVIENNFDVYPSEELSAAWEAQIYPDHGWGGKNGHITDSLFQAKAEFARDEGTRILRGALAGLSAHIGTDQAAGMPLFVFNDQSWERTDPVTCDLEFEPGQFTALRLLDERRLKIAFDLKNVEWYEDGSLKRAALHFIAADVPPIGYKTWYITPAEPPGAAGGKAASSDSFENDFYRITFVDGGIKQIYDKQLGRDLFNTGKFLAGELFTMTSVGNGAGEFAEIQQPTMENFDRISRYKPKWSLVSNNNVAAQFSLEQKLPNCTVRQIVTVYHRIKRLDFAVDLLDWDGTKNREFRLAFPVNVAAADAKVTYEVPFGKVTVGEDEIPGAAGERYEQPAAQVHPREVQDWINVSGADFGLTMSSSVAVCDYIDPTDEPVDYPIIQPLLLASRRSCHGEGNWYLQEGDHHFQFSFSSHEPGWQKGYKSAKQVNRPLHVVVGNGRPQQPRLPASMSFCSLSAPNVMISTIKKCEDDNSVILRCFEMEGKDSDVNLMWFQNPARAAKTNLIEEEMEWLPAEGKSLHTRIGHHAIETFKLVR